MLLCKGEISKVNDLFITIIFIVQVHIHTVFAISKRATPSEDANA